MKNTIIGIIGGAGVAATNMLNTLIENQLTRDGAFRDAHHPEIIIWQATQAPSRSMFLEGRGESFIEDYVRIAKQLEQCGATRICMCCNTAHYAIDTIQAAIGVPMINLVEQVILRVAQTNFTRFGLVASDGCLLGKVYEKYHQKHCPEKEIIYPDAEFQKLVTLGICNTKNTARFEDEESPNRPKNIFARVKEHLYSKGAEIIVWGCTDIRVDYSDSENIDSLEILQEEIIKAVR